MYAAHLSCYSVSSDDLIKQKKVWIPGVIIRKYNVSPYILNKHSIFISASFSSSSAYKTCLFPPTRILIQIK